MQQSNEVPRTIVKIGKTFLNVAHVTFAQRVKLYNPDRRMDEEALEVILVSGEKVHYMDSHIKQAEDAINRWTR